MAIMARAANLRGYRELIDELGGDGAGLLRRFGITPEAIADDDALVPAESLGRALKVAMDFLDRNYPDPERTMTTLVGLREQSALTRVVRRWYGTTPQRIRSAARVP